MALMHEVHPYSTVSEVDKKLAVFLGIRNIMEDLRDFEVGIRPSTILTELGHNVLLNAEVSTCLVGGAVATYTGTLASESG